MATSESVADRPGGSAGMSWAKLLRYSAIAGIAVIVLITVFGGEVIPPLVVFAVLWVAGLVWLSRATKGPAIFLLVTFVAFVVLSAPFAIPTLTVPASAGDFILNIASLLAAFAGIAGAVGVVRGRGDDTGPARSIALAAAGILVLATALGVFSAVTYDDAERQEGDVELVAKDIKFEQTTIEASGGEVSVFVENQDPTLHTFTIEELDVDLDVPASKSARITFDAEPGDYEFFCEPHKETMKGTLTVE